MKIKGYVQTTAAIHIADASEGNQTSIATFPVMDYDHPDGARVSRVPGVKATVLRGLMRKTADDIAIEAMVRHGVKVPAEVFNALRHGSTSGRMTKDAASPAILSAMKAHPLMGLFGGGPRSGAGAFSCGWMLPLCQETVRNNLVPGYNGYEEKALPGYQLVDNRNTMYPKVDMVLKHEDIFDEVIEDAQEKAAQMLQADAERRAKGKTEEGDSTERSSNLLTFNTLMAGALLHLDMAIADKAPDHVKGFALVTLARALNANRIGGMQRIGVGRDVFNLASVANNVTLDGEPLFEFDGEELVVVDHGKARDLVDAFEAWHQDGKAWTSADLWEATGFTGIDLGEAAVKKAGKGRGKKAA